MTQNIDIRSSQTLSLEAGFQNAFNNEDPQVFRDFMLQHANHLSEKIIDEILHSGAYNKEAQIETIITLAAGKISAESLKYFYSPAYKIHNLNIMVKNLELAADKLSIESVNNAFYNAAYYNQIELLLKIWELAADKISVESIDNAFYYAAYLNHMDILLKVWEWRAGKISVEFINGAFSKAAKHSYIGMLSKIWELTADKISVESINTAFTSAAENSNMEIFFKIWELAANKISVESINTAFIAAAKNLNIEVLSKIWELAADRISAESINYTFIYFTYTNDTDMLFKIWELAADKISTESLNQSFEKAIRNSNTEVLLKIWELAADKFSEQFLNTAFQNVISYGQVELILITWDLLKHKIYDENINKVFQNICFKIINANFDFIEPLFKIWDFAANKISKENINKLISGSIFVFNDEMRQLTLKAFEYINKNEQNDTINADSIIKILFNKLLTFSNPETFSLLSVVLKELQAANIHALSFLNQINAEDIINLNVGELCQKYEILSEAAIPLSSQVSDINLIEKMMHHGLFHKNAEHKILGFTNYIGEWSHNLIDHLQQNSYKVSVVSLSLKHTKNEKLMSLFDGFINPGAGDTFPSTEEFNLDYLQDMGKEHEYAYQNTINYAKQHHLPYLGICNGAQHLILNAGGYIARTATPHKSGYHTFKVKPGSIIHYLAMDREEQSAAVAYSYFPNLEFRINTQHNYAGVHSKLSDLELGGLSDQEVVEAIAKNFYQVGFQFHPENMYQDEERNNNLLKNSFRHFIVKEKIDMELFNQYMVKEWTQAFQNAKCFMLEDSHCPNGQLVVFRDIFVEAVEYATVNIHTTSYTIL